MLAKGYTRWGRSPLVKERPKGDAEPPRRNNATQTKTASTKENRETPTEMSQPQRLDSDQTNKLPFSSTWVFLCFVLPVMKMCLAFSVEKNQRVSSVLFNPNVKNDAHERRLVQ